jgi:hypothetical protein
MQPQRIGDFDPIRLGLRPNANLAPQHSAKGDEGRDRDEVRRALHPLRYIRNPRRYARGQEIQIESRHRR